MLCLVVQESQSAVVLSAVNKPYNVNVYAPQRLRACGEKWDFASTHSCFTAAKADAHISKCFMLRFFTNTLTKHRILLLSRKICVCVIFMRRKTPFLLMSAYIPSWFVVCCVWLVQKPVFSSSYRRNRYKSVLCIRAVLWERGLWLGSTKTQFSLCTCAVLTDPSFSAGRSVYL